MIYLLPLAAPAAMLAAPALPYFICICRRLFRRDITMPICRRLKIFIAAAIVIIALSAGLVGSYKSCHDSYAPIFAEAKRQLRAIPGGRLVLVRPSESLSGAAVFYCLAVTPQINEWKDLKKGDVALAILKKKEPVPQLPEGFSARRFPDIKLLFVSPVP